MYSADLVEIDLRSIANYYSGSANICLQDIEFYLHAKTQGRRSSDFVLRAPTDRQTNTHTHGTDNITSSANARDKCDI